VPEPPIVPLPPVEAPAVEAAREVPAAATQGATAAAASPPAPAASTTPAATPAAQDSKRPLRVAVRDIEGASEDDQRVAQVATAALVAELRKLQRTSVVSLDEVKTLLDFEAEKQLVGCDTDSCLAEIVEALGVDVLIVGQIATIDTQRVFGLKALDQREGRATAQVDKPLERSDGEECLAMIGPAVATLFPDVPLRAGLARGVDPAVALRLNPPPLDPWVVYSGAAVTGALVLTGVGATVVNGLSAQAAQEKIAAASFANPADGAALKGDTAAVQTSFLVLTASFASAAVAGAATGVLALFADWHGYRDGE
jgi:hypothetical protein